MKKKYIKPEITPILMKTEKLLINGTDYNSSNSRNNGTIGDGGEGGNESENGYVDADAKFNHWSNDNWDSLNNGW